MRGFDIKRFALILKWDVVSNWKYSFKLMLTMMFAMFAIFAMSLFSRRGVEMTGWTASDMVAQMSGFSMLLFGVCMIVGASRIFSNMKTKQQRTAFLMMPASAAEKFLARWLWATVGQMVIFVAALVIADLLQMLFGALIGVGVLGSVTAGFFRLICDIMGGGAREFYYAVDKDTFTALTISAFVLSLAVFTHAFYVLGGVFFRRNPWLLTTCAGFILIFGLTVVSSFMDLNGIDDSLATLDPMTLVHLCTGVLLLLTVAAYWLAYWLFRRMQVINNKWTNV